MTKIIFNLVSVGAVELAAVGVSVAIFNQASRITIFPLVSITTSFVAEEDAIGKTAIKPVKCDTEKHLAENGQKRERTSIKKENMLENSSSASLASNEPRNSAPHNGAIPDLEKNPSEAKCEELEKKSSKQDGKKESILENATLENVEKGIKNFLVVVQTRVRVVT